MPRIKLGDYIIDVDPDESTTAGVALLVADDETGRFNVAAPIYGTSTAGITFGVIVTADDDAALKTAMETVRDECRNANSVAYQETTTTVWELATSSGSYLTPEVVVEWDDIGTNAARAIITYTFPPVQAAAGGGAGAPATTGDPEGLSGSVIYTLGYDAQGNPSGLAEATFTETEAAAAAENAQAWLDLWDDSGNWPLGWPTYLRVVESELRSTTQGTSIASVALQPPSETALDGLAAGWRLASVNISIDPGSIDEAAGTPLSTISITGTLTYLVRDSDGAVTPPSEAELSAAFEIIKTAALARTAYGEINAESRGYSVSDSGVYSLAIAGTVGGNVTRWIESVDISATANATISSSTDGFVVYAGNPAASTTVIHSLDVEAYNGAPEYVLPGFMSGLKYIVTNVNDRLPRTRVVRSEAGAPGAILESRRYSRTYELLADAKTSLPPQINNSVGPITRSVQKYGG